LDLPKASAAGVISTAQSIVSQPSLNQFAAQGKAAVSTVRKEIITAFKTPTEAALACLVPVDSGSEDASVQMYLPFATRDFTDFTCSTVHAVNMGRIFTGSEKLDPSFLRNPIAYHGRASSLVVSGTPVRRPQGTQWNRLTGEFHFGPSKMLDFEVEMVSTLSISGHFGALSLLTTASAFVCQGYIISQPSGQGERINVKDAKDHIFGIVMVNDWSARDHQPLEMNILGPFNSKNFATSVSPWVVTLEALEPFTVPGPVANDMIAPHLTDDSGKSYGTWFDVQIEASVNGTVVSNPNLQYMQYSPEQMVAHHSLGGCPMSVGDLLATGTVSSSQDNVGCLCEKTNGGKNSFEVSGGETRLYLQDGDTVKFNARAGGEGSGVGWGDLEGTILEALPL